MIGFQNGNAQLLQQSNYAVASGMFARLANLYSQYRVISVQYEWHGETMAGSRGFYHTPALAWNSPDGSSNSLPAGVEDFARAPVGVFESFP